MAGDPTGRRIGGYEVEDELAQGGMGVVYLAQQPSLERRVVLKTLRRDLAEDPTAEERFTREAQAAARVHHPNVVVVYDCFSWRNERFIAQEHVDGKDVASVLAQVRGALNAVAVRGTFSGPTLYCGAGAGSPLLRSRSGRRSACPPPRAGR